ncbi:hypothetical protein Pmani_037578 [Petrolisthes manimaculis]|uniref:Uncharacterized protein n=1 Tax=Petrolisthes manimaculis TaxID=1843537 RepID=A0AAE1NHX4_9EUCA|nr:hypothetical protein Pmani_037578 [Petrolisthes manimaculis]
MGRCVKEGEVGRCVKEGEEERKHMKPGLTWVQQEKIKMVEVWKARESTEERRGECEGRPGCSGDKS